MEEQTELSKLATENARLKEDNARLRAQLLASTTGNPEDEAFLVVSRETLTRWAQEVRANCVDDDSGCCRDCGAYVKTMPHLEDCKWEGLTEELDRYTTLHPAAPARHPAQLDCVAARTSTLRSMGLNEDVALYTPLWNAAWKMAVRACALAEGPDLLTAEEWVKLRDWAQDDDRAPAKTAFTAGAARDAASAFEAAFHKDPLLARPSVTYALREAVAVLYLADNSDYRGALWNIVRSLSPRLWQLLQDNARAASNEAETLHRSAIERELASSSADERRWQYIAANNYCEVPYSERRENFSVEVRIALGAVNPLNFMKQDKHGYMRLSPALIDAAILQQNLDRG
ncbi:hypothetical protein [Burkholderia cenocepacia]|uniref:hypothetical protein n=1 Tax=Burkholderia cenocepacia TaxID=95486 RepID=UPI000761D03F|nr:hypothetical protein [Burkholderia cenocepacia]KWU23441.1 hypothetical protein AS149_37260 [Burkholderia cenocepacia]